MPTCPCCRRSDVRRVRTGVLARHSEPDRPVRCSGSGAPGLVVTSVTGHRPDRIPDPERQLWVRRMIRAILTEGLGRYGARLRIRCGMALGTDTWVAEECVALGIPFAAYLPFAGHADQWPLTQQLLYRELLRQAEQVVVVCEGGWRSNRDNWKFLRRNEEMLNGADVLLAVWAGDSRGGTAHAVRHWRKTHHKHYWINPTSGTTGWWQRGTPG